MAVGFNYLIDYSGLRNLFSSEQRQESFFIQVVEHDVMTIIQQVVSNRMRDRMIQTTRVGVSKNNKYFHYVTHTTPQISREFSTRLHLPFLCLFDADRRKMFSQQAGFFHHILFLFYFRVLFHTIIQ